MLSLHQLLPDDPPDYFPPTSQALTQPNGLLAFGGDLSPARLIAAYQRGIFPWYSDGEPILWWAPNPRTVFIPGKTHISRRLARKIRQQQFAITMDTAFDRVVLECAKPRKSGPETWLIPEMREAYCHMHTLGYAHSIEVWQEKRLVAGLYGIALGKAFFGESMFCLVADMSKVALTLLSQQLSIWGFRIIDAQVASPHLYSLGAVDMHRIDFQKCLTDSIESVPEPGHWKYDKNLPSSANHLPEL